jgi:hypothetical protein
MAGPGRLHWQCRSTSIAMLKGQKTRTGTRSSAGGLVDVNLTYGHWLRQQSPAVQDEVLGKAKDERYRKDGMSDVSFVNDRGQTLTLKQMPERDASAFGA